MITKTQAQKALDNGTMCYATDGQSVTIVAVTWGEQWNVEVEYSDGSRTHRNPADITLAVSAVTPLLVAAYDDLFYQYSEDSGKTFTTYACVSGETAQTMHEKNAQLGMVLGRDYRFIKA